MKIKFDRKTLLKLACLILILVALPLGAAELLLLVDLGGIDFAITFLLVYFAAIRDSILFKYHNFKSEVRDFLEYASKLYMFQPKVFVPHLSASGVIVALTASVFCACLLWVPVIYLSSGLIS